MASWHTQVSSQEAQTHCTVIDTDGFQERSRLMMG